MFKMSSITLSNSSIGAKHPCFIIAEAGVNHNGDLNLAKKMIDAAAQAGVDAVKFQYIRANRLYVENAGIFRNQWNEEMDIYKVWKKTEMPSSWLPELSSYCQQNNLLFFTSVFDEKSVDEVDPYVSLYKIGSSELTHIPLLQKVAKTGKPIIFSIGGAELTEVQEAVQAIKAEGNTQIGMLYCVVTYPAPLEEANVKAVKTLQQLFPDIVIGYSDHSFNPIQVPAAAVYQGAKIIEKHFTLSRNLEGIDHKMSLEPSELKAMVEAIRTTEQDMKLGKEPRVSIDNKVFGKGDIKLTAEQNELIQFVRRKIFSLKDIPEGERFTSENSAVLRPGNRTKTVELESSVPLHPRDYEQVLHSTARKNIPALSILCTEDITAAP